MRGRLNSFQSCRSKLLCISRKRPCWAPKLPCRPPASGIVLCKYQIQLRPLYCVSFLRCALTLKRKYFSSPAFSKSGLKSCDSGRCLKQASAQTPLSSSFSSIAKCVSSVCNMISYFVINICVYKTFLPFRDKSNHIKLETFLTVQAVFHFITRL